MNESELIRLYSENIRRFRLSKKLTQERLAERAGITSAYVSEIENRKKSVNSKRLLRLRRHLKLNRMNFSWNQALYKPTTVNGQKR